MVDLQCRIIWNEQWPDLKTPFDLTVHGALIVVSPNSQQARARSISNEAGEVTLTFAGVDLQGTSVYEISVDASGVTEERTSNLRADVWAAERKTGPLSADITNPQVVLDAWFSSRRSD